MKTASPLLTASMPGSEADEPTLHELTLCSLFGERVAGNMPDGTTLFPSAASAPGSLDPRLRGLRRRSGASTRRSRTARSPADGGLRAVTAEKAEEATRARGRSTPSPASVRAAAPRFFVVCVAPNDLSDGLDARHPIALFDRLDARIRGADEPSLPPPTPGGEVDVQLREEQLLLLELQEGSSQLSVGQRPLSDAGRSSTSSSGSSCSSDFRSSSVSRC